MNYTIEQRGKIVIFTLKHTNLNSEVSAKLKAELLIVCQPDIDALILDLTMVEAVDSSGLSAILLSHRQLHELEIPIYLVGVHGMVETMMNISQMNELYYFVDTIEEAVEDFENNPV